jgi:hypothetical protein
MTKQDKLNPKDTETFIFDDGGREAAGYKGFAGDCTVRAIAIATEKPYKEVYDALFEMNRTSNTRKKTRCSNPGCIAWLCHLAACVTCQLLMHKVSYACA